MTIDSLSDPKKPFTPSKHNTAKLASHADTSHSNVSGKPANPEPNHHFLLEDLGILAVELQDKTRVHKPHRVH